MATTALLIRDARKRAKLTQEQLADRASTSQSALARYETGVALPTIPTLERLMIGCGRHLQIRSVPAGSERPTSARSLVGTRAEVLRKRRSELVAAARRHGVRGIHIFGSVARGEATSESDVDLLVHLDDGRTLIDLAAFQREASEVLGLPVDVATADMLKPAALETALRDALPI